MVGFRYEAPEDVIRAIDFLRWFVKHEIKDDGLPVIAYFARVVERTPGMSVEERMQAILRALTSNVPAGTPNATPVILRDPGDELQHRSMVHSVAQVLEVCRTAGQPSKPTEAAAFFTAYLASHKGCPTS